jgi:hypothetical protein
MLRRSGQDRDEGVFEMPDEGMRATIRLFEYFNADIAERARGATSRDDIVTTLLAARDAGRIGHEYVLGYIYILAIAGNETTTKLIGNICYQLHRHPDQMAMLLADMSLLPSAIEETMRYDGPTQMMARTTTRDVELHGRTIPKGAKVALLFTSANRDERKFADGESFDLRRDPRDHLGSAVACTPAWARRWRGWRPGSQWRRSWPPSAGSRSTRRGWNGCTRRTYADSRRRRCDSRVLRALRRLNHAQGRQAATSSRLPAACR